MTLFLTFLACGGGTDDSGTPQSTDTAPPLPEGVIDYDACLFELDLWCHNSEGAGGPDATDPCDPTTAAELMAESRPAWRGQCEDPVHGTLEVVNIPTGYGGPYWYFDAAGVLVAYTYSTDINVFCEGNADGGSFGAAYGFRPQCDSLCLLEDETEGYGPSEPCE